jgi:hypothetical protein
MQQTDHSANAFGLAAPSFGVIPKKKFRWVQGTSGFQSTPVWTDLYLVANDGPSRIISPPTDVFIDFNELELTEPSLLGFAHRFGRLGVKEEHFHLADGSAGWGETISSWRLHVDEFQRWFNIWQLTKEGNRNRLQEGLISAGVPLKPRGIDRMPPTTLAVRLAAAISKDPEKTAQGYLIDRVNRYLAPSISMGLPAHMTCYYQGCTAQRYRGRLPELNGHVIWQLTPVKIRNRLTAKPSIYASTLLATIWLQFADLICGEKRVRLCEVCGKLMDISNAVRKGAKRMHETCSNTRRMTRYRMKRKMQAQIGARLGIAEWKGARD